MLNNGGVATQIVEKVAERKGVDSLELDRPLHEVIDADALETIVESARHQDRQTNFRVRFSYYGYQVTVDSTGEVTVDDQLNYGAAEGSVADGTVED